MKQERNYSKESSENFDELEPDALDDLDLSDELSVIAANLDEPIPQDAVVYHLKLSYSHENFFAVYNGEQRLSPGVFVIVPTRYGRDLARVIRRANVPKATSILSRITKIERIAEKEDLERVKNNREQESHAYQVCKEKIIEHRLQMKLVRVHYLFEEGKILFFFTADNRVDFRELVKDLVAIFKTRIELRQIGIRDEARIIGGCGICGRAYCCHSISDKIKPVSIKMAKEQNLSLNSLKISGSCGRLLCCLSYEQGYYSEQRKSYPLEGEIIKWDATSWRVREINVIAGLVTIDSEDGRQLLIPRSRFSKTDGNTWRINN
ncbi:MAG: hypothetical protein LBC77_08505 [Spirochaetaceae bacterium]|jgi:cell fate regulator YaaT (PSP1 superfamily)|nr:hypothetical protein [Spirochaetaceae bacterium]